MSTLISNMFKISTTKKTNKKSNPSKKNLSSSKIFNINCKKCGKKIKYPAFNHGQFHVNYHKKCFRYTK